MNIPRARLCCRRYSHEIGHENCGRNDASHDILPRTRAASSAVHYRAASAATLSYLMSCRPEASKIRRWRSPRSSRHCEEPQTARPSHDLPSLVSFKSTTDDARRSLRGREHLNARKRFAQDCLIEIMLGEEISTKIARRCRSFTLSRYKIKMLSRT